MKKIRNKTYFFLLGLTLFMVWFLVGRFGLFASNGDWFSQHSVIPDQFRQQFYATGQWFPEFAAQLGAGQNIYNYSYYGLYNPVILPSYLLPFVNMGDYLMAVSILCLAASVLLMYYWLGTHGFSAQVRLSVTVVFLLAAPMIYQSHRQIMFVNYMPFLCMALIGVDRYWNKRKYGLYLAGVFLMIMTSFYFSIGGLLALCLYGVSRCEKQSPKRRVFGFIFPTAAAVCLAGVLLVPTACALFARNDGSKQGLSVSLLFPDFSQSRFAYDGYGIGLTIGILSVLFLCLAGRNLKERFLAAGCLTVITIPFFSWVLNGGLYARGKSLIPFLPVFCYLTAVCLEGIRRKEFSSRMYLAGYLASVTWSVCSFLICGHGKLTEIYGMMFAELLLLLLFFLWYQKKRDQTKKMFPVFLLPSMICLLLSAAVQNGNGTDRLNADVYRSVTDDSWGEEISGVLRQEEGLYRLEQSGSHEEKKANINRVWDVRQWSVSSYSSAYQKLYKDFRENVFQTEQPLRNCLMQSVSENPLFQKFMGVKYRVGENAEKDTDGKISVSRQENAAPVIYATDQVIAEDAYRNMAFPYNQTILMRYAAAKGGTEPDTREITASMPDIRETEVRILERLGIHKTDSGYQIETKQKIKTSLAVAGSETDRERILFLQFDVKNRRKSQDVIIELAGIRNNLSAKSHVYYNGNRTFTYVMKLKKGQKKAELLFGEGTYSISNIRSFLGDAAVLSEDSLYQSAFCPDWKMTEGSRICGDMDVVRTGYLVTSIPYDPGFEIWIDGTRAEKEIVNTAFLGAKISKGEHRIEIVYHAPGAFLGKAVSGMALVCLAAAGVLERKKNYVVSAAFRYNFLTILMYHKKKIKAIGGK